MNIPYLSVFNIARDLMMFITCIFEPNKNCSYSIVHVCVLVREWPLPDLSVFYIFVYFKTKFLHCYIAAQQHMQSFDVLDEVFKSALDLEFYLE